MYVCDDPPQVLGHSSSKPIQMCRQTSTVCRYRTCFVLVFSVNHRLRILWSSVIICVTVYVYALVWVIGSDDVFLCNDYDEATIAFNRIYGQRNGLGLINESVLVQVGGCASRCIMYMYSYAEVLHVFWCLCAILYVESFFLVVRNSYRARNM